jgi:hypothetical protein
MLRLKSGQEITAALGGDQPIRVGDRIDPGFAPTAAALFDTAGIALTRA